MRPAGHRFARRMEDPHRGWTLPAPPNHDNAASPIFLRKSRVVYPHVCEIFIDKHLVRKSCRDLVTTCVPRLFGVTPARSCVQSDDDQRHTRRYRAPPQPPRCTRARFQRSQGTARAAGRRRSHQTGIRMRAVDDVRAQRARCCGDYAGALRAVRHRLHVLGADRRCGRVACHRHRRQGGAARSGPTFSGDPARRRSTLRNGAGASCFWSCSTASLLPVSR